MGGENLKVVQWFVPLLHCRALLESFAPTPTEFSRFYPSIEFFGARKLATQANHSMEQGHGQTCQLIKVISSEWNGRAMRHFASESIEFADTITDLDAVSSTFCEHECDAVSNLIHNSIALPWR